MAILFDDAATEYIEVDSTPVTAAPLTMACWANSDSDAASQTLMMIGDKDVTNHRWDMRLRGDVAGDFLNFSAAAGGTAVDAIVTAGYSVNTWHHCCGVEASATDRRAFLDGANKGTNTTSRAPSGSDRLSIGRLGISTPTAYMSGMIAEPAIWNVALTDAEVALLALGVSPFFVRPEALVFYLPMVALGSTTQLDWIGGRTMTEANTPATAAHPPNIIYPNWLTTGWGISLLASTLSGSLHFTGAMSAVPLSATYKIYASDVPKRTFTTA